MTQHYHPPELPTHEVLCRTTVGVRRQRHGARRQTPAVLSKVYYSPDDTAIYLTVGEWQIALFPDVARTLGTEMFNAGLEEGN